MKVLKIKHLPLDDWPTTNGEINEAMPIGGIFDIPVASYYDVWKWKGYDIAFCERKCFRIIDEVNSNES